MFGYIVINKPELKIRDFETYNAFYCGLCKTLKQRHGIAGQATLNYDLTMVALLLTALYEPETDWRHFRCAVHPSGRHTAAVNAYSAYCADMNLLLTYEKLNDDVEDEGKKSSRFFRLFLKRKVKKVVSRYPEKAKAIRAALKELSAAENRGETDLDLVAGCFGRVLEAVCCYQDDVWAKELRRFGFYLGKFIYLLDAYDDLENDAAKGNYNPLLVQRDEPGFEERFEEVLKMMMAEVAQAFEILPIVSYAEILRNILYGGVWTKYIAKREKEPKST